MTCRQIYTRLREEAQKELGVKVYRPGSPDALFVCAGTPVNAGPLFDTVPLEKGTGAVLTEEGTRLLLSLLPEQPRMPEKEGEDAALLTCAERCLWEEQNLPAGRMTVLTLHCLAFSDKARLRRELPGMLSAALREKRGVERTAGLLILNELNEEEERKC